MIYLILAILSSACVSIFMRISEKYCKSRYAILLMNYIACVAAGLICMGAGVRKIGGSGTLTAAGFGIVTGLLYLASFVLLQWNVRKNGVILSSTFMKLGVIVPTLTAVFWFGEEPKVAQIVGIVLAVSAILLINMEKNGEKDGERDGKKSRGALIKKTALILLLLGGGGGDAMAKFFDHYGKPDLGDAFLICTFLTAGWICLFLVVRKKERIAKADILFGFLIGIPNYFSARFLLKALAEIPAVITYPTYSITTMLVIGAAGLFLFGERLTKRQWAAYAVIMLAVGLLNI